MTSHVVIIGASLAGVSCAQRLIDSDADLHITLISDEVDIGYDRPPLSKSLKVGEPLPLVDLDPSRKLDSDKIKLLTGNPATSINLDAKTVEVNGIDVGFDKLVIATGARARKLDTFNIPGAPIKTLRTLADAKEIQQIVESKSKPRVGIVGGGFIGLELASALSTHCSVDLFEAQKHLLSRVLPIGISSRVAARHEAAGVNLHMEAHIARVEGDSSTVKIELNDGQNFEFDLVVQGVGAIPNSEIAGEAGLALANGIAVNESLQTTHPDVYAVGDCCSFPLASNGETVRLESWRNAQEQGLHVAEQIASGEHTKFMGLPWFWSDQYDLGLQMAGWPHPEALRVDRECGDQHCTFELNGDHKLISVAAIGPGNSVAKDVKICERLISAGTVLSPEDLANPDLNLKKLLKG